MVAPETEAGGDGEEEEKVVGGTEGGCLEAARLPRDEKPRAGRDAGTQRPRRPPPAANHNPCISKSAPRASDEPLRPDGRRPRNPASVAIMEHIHNCQPQ